MRILWVSDSPLVPSSYGLQTHELVTRLIDVGHEIRVLGATYVGAPLQRGNYTVVGGPVVSHGTENLLNHVLNYKPDIVVTFKDVFAYQEDVLRRLPVPWCPIIPIDTEPLGVETRQRLRFATQPVAITQNGQALLRDAGVHSLYAPLGIDTKFFTPGNKQESRERLNLPPEALVFGFVGANQSWPSRKSLDGIITAWAAFLEAVPDAVLYLHTDASPQAGGINVDMIVQLMGIPAKNLRVTSRFEYGVGVDAEFVRDIYRASDILLNPAMGEGFGLPVVEAQACGTPVITNNFTAMRETTFSGLRLDSTDRMVGDLMVANIGGFRFRPNTRTLFEAMLWTHEQKQAGTLETKTAREGAKRYDWKVVTPKWITVFEEIENLILEGGIDSEYRQFVRENAERLERTGDARPSVLDS